MEKEKLAEVLALHREWLESDGVKGEKATLIGADLIGADLRWADLRGSDLRGSDLRWADLRWADLRGSDLDYSCFPLGRGGKNWKVDKNLPLMLSAFICSMECEDIEVKKLQGLIRPFAEKSHRASDILD